MIALTKPFKQCTFFGNLLITILFFNRFSSMRAKMLVLLIWKKQTFFNVFDDNIFIPEPILFIYPQNICIAPLSVATKPNFWPGGHQVIKKRPVFWTFLLITYFFSTDQLLIENQKKLWLWHVPADKLGFYFRSLGATSKIENHLILFLRSG